MNALWQDVKYGLRVLLKHPGFTLIAVLALALGVGANTAIFSVVNAVLLRPLPFAQPERLAFGEGMSLQSGEKGGSISPPDFVDIRAQNHVFTQLAAMQQSSYALTGEGEPERATGARVTANFFQTLGVAPLKGRAFLPEEEEAGRNNVAVIGYGLWQRRFGGDANVVGRTVTLSGQTFTVVGVMPQSFQYPRDAMLWTAMALKSPDMTTRRFHFLKAIGRLKDGVTLAQAQADITAITRQLEKQYPDSNADYGMGLTLLPERVIGEMRSSLLLLSVAVGLVLLIACANVANLSLARGASRGKEIAIRAALGAGRGRIIRQLLTESVLLALLGGALGLLLAVWGVDVLVALAPDNLPSLKESGIDLRVLGFTALVSLVTGVLFGLAPALQASRADLNETLKEGGRSAGTESSGRRLRGLLVVAEVALSLVLAVGAGLLVKSFVRLSNVQTGFVPEHVLTLQLALTRANYPKPEQRAGFYQQLLTRVGALPGVEAVGAISELPLSGQEQDTFFTVEGHPPAAAGSSDNDANSRVVSPDYFRAMSIPLLRGRYFTEQDRTGAPNALLISESFARKVFANEDPLGKHVTIDFGEPWTGEIVGVVGNIRHASLADEPYREMYTSAAQTPPGSVNLVVRAAGDPAQLTAAIKQQVQALDKDLPLYNVKTMEARVSEAAAQPRFRTLLAGLFAALAIVLAAIGIYGVISYSVTQRTHEIGVRVALGAQTRDILRLVVGQGMLLGLIGIAIGLIGAFLLTRLLASLLYGVTAHDPLVFGGVALLLTCIALVACYIPARRATKVDPMIALRYE